MAIELEDLALPGPKLVRLPRFGDERGFFCETFSQRAFEKAGLAAVYVQDNQSLSRVLGTVRGLHFQRPPHAQAKLVRVLHGRVLDVAVDLRRGSPSFGRHVAIELHPEGPSLFVPIGFAHGFCTLAPDTEVFYKVTAHYEPTADSGILWNDPALEIAWPKTAGAQVSAKDARMPRLCEIASPFEFAGN